MTVGFTEIQLEVNASTLGFVEQFVLLVIIGAFAFILGKNQAQTLIDTWQAARGTSKRVVTVRPWGRSIRAFKAGVHMTPLPGYGRETFATFAEREAERLRASQVARDAAQ